MQESKSQSLSYSHSTEYQAELEFASIVDELNNGAVEVDTLTGTTMHNYITSTQLTIYGLPGQEYSISAGGFYTPNAKPKARFLMDSYDNGATADYIGGHKAVGQGSLSYDPENGYFGGGSLAFDGGVLSVANHTNLDISTDLFVNLAFEAKISDIIAKHAADPLNTDNSSAFPVTLFEKGSDDTKAYSIELIESEGSYFVQASVTTDIGTHTTLSTLAVSDGEWHRIGLKFQNNQLSLGIDDTRTSVNTTGNLLGSGLGLVIADNKFRGHIDDLQIGQDSVQNSIIAFDNGLTSSSVVIGDNGSASIGVKATGNHVGLSRIVGFTTRLNNSPYVAQELKFNQRVANFISDTLDINQAFAQCRPACKKARAERNGLAVSSKESWGYFKEWAVKKFIGEENLELIKKTAIFIFELTSINDVFVLLKSVYYLSQGDFDKIDGLEVSFAAIGIAVTVVTLVATAGTGAAALLPLKIALSSFKGLMKALIRDIGLDAIFNVAKFASKQVWSVVKKVSNKKALVAELKLLSDGLKGLISNASIKTLKFFVGAVHSMDDFRAQLTIWSKIGGVCVAYQQGLSFGSMYAGVYDKPLDWIVPPAFAASNMCYLAVQRLTDISDSTTSVGKLFGNSTKMITRRASQMDAKLLNQGIILTEDAVEGLAVLAKYTGKDATRRLDMMLSYFPEPGRLDIILTGIKEAHAVRHVGQEIKGLDTLVKQLSHSFYPLANGTEFVLDYVRHAPGGLANIKAFEQSVSVAGVGRKRILDARTVDDIFIENKRWTTNHFKNWSEKGSGVITNSGKYAESARDQLMRDILLTVQGDTSIDKLRWIFSKDIVNDKADIIEFMIKSIKESEELKKVLTKGQINNVLKEFKQYSNQIVDFH